MRKVALLVAILTLSQPVVAVAFTLNGYNLGSDTDTSDLSISCEGNDEAEISCRGVQIMVKEPDREKAEANRLRYLKEFKDPTADKDFQKLCTDVANQKLPLGARPLNSGELAWKEAFGRLCKEKSREAFEAVVNVAYENEVSTCKVWTYEFDPVTLYKINDTTWANKPTPTGLCDAISTMILEVEPDGRNLVTWKQIRTYVDRSSKLCKDYETDKPVVWSWRNDRAQEKNCRFIKFGMF